MPLTPKGEEIKKNMEDTYGSKKKAEQVFYASKNAGTIKGVDSGARDDWSPEARAAAAKARSANSGGSMPTIGRMHPSASSSEGEGVPESTIRPPVKRTGGALAPGRMHPSTSSSEGVGIPQSTVQAPVKRTAGALAPSEHSSLAEAQKAKAAHVAAGHTSTVIFQKGNRFRVHPTGEPPGVNDAQPPMVTAPNAGAPSGGSGSPGSPPGKRSTTPSWPGRIV